MINSNKVGLVIGALFVGWHGLWIGLILLGWAQPLLDFVFWAHMIKPVYLVKPFDPKAAISLVIMTFAVGYAIGSVSALLWNKLHRGS